MNLVKKLIVFISGLAAYFSLAVPVFADAAAAAAADGSMNICDSTDTTTINGALCALTGNNAGTVVKNVIIFIVVLAIIIAVLYLLYGGIKWIMSKGDKTEVESARNHITAAIVGLIVVFLAIFIVSIILALFGLDFATLTLPTITGTTP